MKARHAWTQDGAKMEENIAIRFDGARGMDFRSVLTANGSEAAVFGGCCGARRGRADRLPRRTNTCAGGLP